jgi:diguanylate cyclase (GGDEF)-like protein
MCAHRSEGHDGAVRTLRQPEVRSVDGGGHDPYRRLPSLLYGLYGAESPGDVRARILDALRLLVTHDDAQLVEVDSEDLRVALASKAPARHTPDALDLRDDALALTLTAHGVHVGTLRVRREGGFVPREVAFLGRFAELAALALVNAHARMELQRLASTDPLTGLGNRRQLAEELARWTADVAWVSLLLVDFDGLKAVNDALGYEEGDRLICAVSRVLMAEMRAGETAARLGGDEFVAVLPRVDEAEALERARALSTAIDCLEHRPEVARLFRGASVGVVAALPDESPKELLRRAADDMQRRKRERKGAPTI